MNKILSSLKANLGDRAKCRTLATAAHGKIAKEGGKFSIVKDFFGVPSVMKLSPS